MADIDRHRQRQGFSRNFVPHDIDLDEWSQIEPLFRNLQERPISSAAELQAWLLDLSELESVLSEESSARYIHMTCHTDSPEFEKAFLHYVEDIQPKCEPEYFAINRKYLSTVSRGALPRGRFFVYDRACENEVQLFREESIPLNTEDEVLGQQYQKTFGEMTVDFDGKEQTLPQLSRYFEETDREVRRNAWKASVGRQLEDRAKIEAMLDKMIGLREQIAQNADFPDFIGYQFRKLHRFDYGPEQCRAFHSAVEKYVVPICRALHEKRRRQLGLGKLTPWDTDVDPLGRPPLRPFETAQELIEGAHRIFAAVDPLFDETFGILRDKDLLDLESRKGKAPGGYQSTLDEVRLPFIFTNAAGRNHDVFTLLHEGGHAFHALAVRDEPLYAYRQPPIEFCEVASMGMEMMACEKLDAFYDPLSAERARQMHIEDVLFLLPWIARVDAFQHWMYLDPSHTHGERAEKWLELDRRFGSVLDWPEYPEWRSCSWIRQLHIFCAPLYYIEYGIAQLGALQLWSRYLDNPKEAVERYWSALSLGGSKPLPELFAAADLQFAFDEATIQPLMEKAAAALDVED